MAESTVRPMCPARAIRRTNEQTMAAVAEARSRRPTALSHRQRGPTPQLPARIGPRSIGDHPPGPEILGARIAAFSILYRTRGHARRSYAVLQSRPQRIAHVAISGHRGLPPAMDRLVAGALRAEMSNRG